MCVPHRLLIEQKLNDMSFPPHRECPVFGYELVETTPNALLSFGASVCGNVSAK